MSYQFKRYMSSLKTGISYTAGATVPDALLNEPGVVAAMLASGDIELIIESEPAPLEEPLEELPVEDVKPTKKKAKK